MLISIVEFGKFQKKKVTAENSLEHVFLEEKLFEQLKRWASHHPLATLLLKWGIKNGDEFIQFQNYVGYLHISTDLHIEILPKNTSDIAKARLLFLKLLQQLPNFPYKTNFPVSISVGQLPLLDCFIEFFSYEVEKIVQQGLIADYHYQQADSMLVKGKVAIHSQLQRYPVFEGKIAQIEANFTVDNIPNRLLKTALFLLLNQTHQPNLQQKIRQLLHKFNLVSFTTKQPIATENYTSNRKYHRYRNALWWANVFLQNQSPSVWSGQQQQLSLLFPMEKLFENYVATGFSRFTNGWKIQLQPTDIQLFINTTTNKKHSLRPDIVLWHNTQSIVIDTKWKLLDDTKPTHQLQRSDLYQLFTYTKKYNARKSLVIYPKSASFEAEIPPFHFDASTELHVIAFDLAEPLESEIKKILLKHIYD